MVFVHFFHSISGFYRKVPCFEIRLFESFVLRLFICAPLFWGIALYSWKSNGERERAHTFAVVVCWSLIERKRKRKREKAIAQERPSTAKPCHKRQTIEMPLSAYICTQREPESDWISGVCSVCSKSLWVRNGAFIVASKQFGFGCLCRGCTVKRNECKKKKNHPRGK